GGGGGPQPGDAAARGGGERVRPNALAFVTVSMTANPGEVAGHAASRALPQVESVKPASPEDLLDLKEVAPCVLHRLVRGHADDNWGFGVEGETSLGGRVKPVTIPHRQPSEPPSETGQQTPQPSGAGPAGQIG